MAFTNSLLERWRSGRPTFGGWLVSDDPQVAEFMAACGFDEVCLDQQHGLASAATMAGVFRSIELHGAVPTTRVPSHDPAAIGRALDLGALAVIVPMVSTAEEAARAVAACRYPLAGHRSAGPVRGPIVRSGGEMSDFEEVATVVMIETADGVRNADAIAATPGVAAIYVGPSDLAISLGLPWEPSQHTRDQAALHREAIERIRQACVRHGVAPGMHCGDAPTALGYLEQGFLMLTVASDLGLIRAGGAAELAAMRQGLHGPAVEAGV